MRFLRIRVPIRTLFGEIGKWRGNWNPTGPVRGQNGKASFKTRGEGKKAGEVHLLIYRL